MTTIAHKLSSLRQLMQHIGIDYYYVPSRDEHNNEYVPDCWQRRQWLSHFTGSAGDMMVGIDTAYLWTDSRYFLQAEQQLAKEPIQLMKIQPGTPSLRTWLQQQPSGIKVGVDPKLISINQAADWQQLLAEHQGELISLETNLIDQIWKDQPNPPLQPVILQPTALAGITAAQKLHQLRTELTACSVQAQVLITLDAIAWLLNLRGSDIAYNPVTIAFLIVTVFDATLFIDAQKLSPEVIQACQQQGIHIAAYEDFAPALNQLPLRVLLDANSISWWVEQQLRQNVIILAPSPVSLMKAIKNPTEIKGMHDAHHVDAIALIKFFNWLEQNWRRGIDELVAAEHLDDLRQQHPQCQGLSFTTISAFAEHGAIVHYQPTPSSAKQINDNHLYLVDSGGQYENGTTDVTRTLHLGNPTQQEKYHYTLVLKGHLALRHAIFPIGASGNQLDSLARQFLWQIGFNYGHGTGHGVGCYLCVHEGPQGISPNNNIPLEPGMMLSNEPGMYLEGRYGIRIENVCQVSTTSMQGFYTFSDLTLVPYARNLIELSLLSPEELGWINEYHELIYAKFSEQLTEEERAWLRTSTEPLQQL